jgi:hypothetical protein
MRPTRLLAPLAVAAMLFGLGACHIELLGDLEVAWTYDGVQDTTACTTHGIDTWRVELRGPEPLSWEQPCGTKPWDTDVGLYDIIEGTYSVTVLALDANGMELASRLQSGVDVIGIGPRITLDFTATDFNGGGSEKVNVYWNINGTEDGTAKGQSWDTCDEVGAAQAIVLVNNKEHTFHCKGSGYPGKVTMSAAVSVTGKPTVQVKLVDSSGASITTMSPLSPGPSSAGTDTWEYVAEFYHDAFTTTKNGVYAFTTTFENGKTCSQLSPPVDLQVALLKLNNNPVTADVCDASSTCVKTNGADTLACSAGTQQLSSLEWGEYVMKISGAVGPAPGTICWEQEFKKQDMLIGAGDSNPVVTLDVPRTSTTGACQ